MKSKPINLYGDEFKPAGSGHGVDIASQRQDELDLASLDTVRSLARTGRLVTALELGGGYGAHSVNMALAGASVTMVDVEDMASTAFAKAIAEKSLPPDALHFIQKDFCRLADHEIPSELDVLYSQRAIHFVPHRAAESLLRRIFARMTSGGMAFISAAGYDTEYGKTYPGRDKRVEERFDFVAPDMQERHAIFQKIVIYTEADMASLLQSAGFAVMQIRRSPFGNIKATAMKLWGKAPPPAAELGN